LSQRLQGQDQTDGRRRVGVGYRYPHDAKDGIVDQDDLGVERTYYTPTDRGAEKEVRRRWEPMRALEDDAKNP